MRYVSLFSGIEAATVAWEPLGWEPVAFAEIDPFPCAVLQERWPHVPNLGDVCAVDWNIPYRGKEHPADGPRYKALGNSMAVPVIRWIGERMQEVDAICAR